MADILSAAGMNFQALASGFLALSRIVNLKRRLGVRQRAMTG